MNKRNFKHGICSILGRKEFSRQLAEKKRRNLGINPRKFTGLSLKTMTSSEYYKKYRQLKKHEKQNNTSSAHSKIDT